MKSKLLPMAALVFIAAFTGRADVLELKNGKTLNGKYVGGTAGTIRFETGEGVQVVETSQALALTFTGGSAAKPAGAAAPAAAAAAAATVTIPAGTTLTVRMVDSVSSKDKEGKRFAATLDSDVTVNGAVALKAGTKIYGKIQDSKQARRYTGQSSLNLELTELTVGSVKTPLVTSGYSDTGARSGGKVARSAATGAAIGGIADGGEGAGKGAAIGAVASGLKKGEAVTVNSGSLLDFQLKEAITIQPAK